MGLSSIGHAAAAASCANYSDEVTVTGIATKKAVYLEPGDFAWGPANGFQAYTVLVSSTPICFYDRLGNLNEIDSVAGVYVLQLVARNLPAEASLQDGVRMTVKGKLFPQETAHHFEKLVFEASSVTLD